ncbi:GNAT family N-acetyltransferase [Kitasatospora sp. NPDC056446]|uniref:GNAT family N-acetyltransferase n=1 Tax=Kitasatospora sp. NPDC056446 TaxID=3345819 RepID=UPI0036989B67
MTVDEPSARTVIPAVAPALTRPVARPAALPGGLVLRESRPEDQEQIEALLAERGDATDALDHRLVAEDPDTGRSATAVVVDGDRVVSTATLLDEELRLGTVRLPAGQLELVATDEEYEGRGLVRALTGWAHARSAERGHLVQVMIGIPYFYRQFGYEYAIDIPVSRPLRGTPPDSGTSVLRTATAADLPALTALQDTAQRGFDVAMPHSAACWRWLLAHEASTLRVVERAGAVVAAGRNTPVDDGVFHLAEAAAADEQAALDLLAGVAASAPGAKLRVVHRPGTLPADAWHDLVEHAPRGEAQQYYVRVPDPTALLDRLRPLFWQRLVTAGLNRAGDDLIVSTFRAHHRIPVDEQGLGAVVTGGPMQGPSAEGGAGVAPDQLAPLLLGPHGIEGLSRIRPDVYPGARMRVYRALFPPLTADLLTYYLP